MIKEFIAFIKEYKIVGLAVAFIMGVATNTLVQSLVDNLIMPFTTPLLPGEYWKEAVVSIGSIKLLPGAFAADVLQFIILAFVVFLIAKKLLKATNQANS